MVKLKCPDCGCVMVMKIEGDWKEKKVRVWVCPKCYYLKNVVKEVSKE